MSIREELILKVLAKEDSVVELAHQYGVSRKTIYKWLSRYDSKGLSGLVDESRRPKRSPMKTSAELALEIVQLRKEHPRWGPKKIVAIMAKRHPGMTVPSIVTVARVLRDAGLQQRVLRRQSGGLSPVPAHLIPGAAQLLTGQIRLGRNGGPCEGDPGRLGDGDRDRQGP